MMKIICNLRRISSKNDIFKLFRKKLFKYLFLLNRDLDKYKSA